MNDSQNFQKKFEEQAILWGEALKIGDHQKANKVNRLINNTVKIFMKDRVFSERILEKLLKHTNPSVRLLASVHALNLDINIHEAEDILTQVANDPNIHVIQLIAQINLQKWKEKKPGVGLLSDEPAIIFKQA